MKFVAWKVLDAADASGLTSALKQGLTISVAGSDVIDLSISRPHRNGHTAKAEKDGEQPKKRVARRRRSRPRLSVTPELRAEMAALREKGKVWRIIGRRWGVSASRAWQIVKNGK